jgi:hypothetical protein
MSCLADASEKALTPCALTLASNGRAAAVRHIVLLSGSLRNKSSKEMALPHPKSRKEHYGNHDKANAVGVLWNLFKRTINITEYRNAKDDVNPAKNRALGGIFHNEFGLHSAIPRHFLWPNFILCKQISVYPHQDLLRGRKEPCHPVVGTLLSQLDPAGSPTAPCTDASPCPKR